jgi:hypothetical protein
MRVLLKKFPFTHLKVAYWFIMPFPLTPRATCVEGPLFVTQKPKASNGEQKEPLEASWRHLLECPSHIKLQKVRDDFGRESGCNPLL